MGTSMNDKVQAIWMLKDVLQRWEELLAGLSEEEISREPGGGGMSVKAEMAHLWAWQQRTVARSEAALRGGEPRYPPWPERLGPDPEEDVDETNAWIDESNRGRAWASVYADWKGQFERLLELSEEIPEKDLMEPGRYAWMGGDALVASLEGTYEHHEEHMEDLLARLDRKGA